MARRVSRVRKIINDYTEGKHQRTYALGSGLVFISPAASLKKGDGSYYIHTYITPPKGKPFWVGTCRAFRFSEADTCKHIQMFQEQLDVAMQKILDSEDETRKAMMKEIYDGRKTRLADKKKARTKKK